MWRLRDEDNDHDRRRALPQGAGSCRSWNGQVRAAAAREADGGVRRSVSVRIKCEEATPRRGSESGPAVRQRLEDPFGVPADVARTRWCRVETSLWGTTFAHRLPSRRESGRRSCGCAPVRHPPGRSRTGGRDRHRAIARSGLIQAMRVRRGCGDDWGPNRMLARVDVTELGLVSLTCTAPGWPGDDPR